ncbi:MAG: sodium:solute symporter family protein [Bacteroidetes bacterium]|nr:sodium:solute symporter family protein [Bacteroidota bacterium]
MNLLGLGLIDWVVIGAYFVVLILIGAWVRRRVKNTSDFYQGNRSFGRILVTFLNFGTMTDAGQTAGVTSEIYRQGLQGVWFQNLVLFHTPVQWFTAALQRRARYLAPGDLYQHRFESRFLAGLYAAVLLAVAVYANAFGYILTGKTLQAIMVKPVAEYTVEERESVTAFNELQRLKALDYARLNVPERTSLATLQEREKRGELHTFASYLDLDSLRFYILYALMIAAYTALGGLLAVALIDIIQGVLIVFLSLALIPTALSHIGGIAGMQHHIPHHAFELFGTSPTSDYTWYFVASFALLNLVVNAPKSFTLGGSAKDDNAARIGFVSGAVFKRFMMIAWAFTGLLAVGLYAGKISDPTNIWGFMTRDLLGAGAVGLMIAAIFSANMDGNATVSLEASAALIRNVLLPLWPDSSERTQVMLGRLLVLAVLVASIFFARVIANEKIMVVFSYILTVGSIVGPSFWLVYFWRRLNTRAVAAQMIVSIILTVAIPILINIIPGATTDPGLTVQTRERIVQVEAQATAQDVEAGRANAVGATFMKEERIPPTGIYFATVARQRPNDTASPMEGKGLFRPQIWLLSKAGVDFSTWTKPGIATASMLFDATVPFILLIAFSLITKRNSEPVLREFYARIHTPAVADPELDARLVREKVENPELVERDKIFPGSDWEFWRPTRTDVIGFFACIAFVGLIVLLYMLVASIGT